MRDLVIGAAIFGGLLWAIRSASGSILVLNWIWFQRPYDFSYGWWNNGPFFAIALCIAGLSNLLRGQLRLRFPPILVVYLALLCWVTFSTFFAFDGAVAWSTYAAFLPSMWVGPPLLFAAIHGLPLLRSVLWVAAGSIGVNACKTGASLMMQGGAHVTQQISGFVGDNNVFGLVLCLAAAILMGLRSTLPKSKWVRGAFFVGMGFVMLTIIYTKSRGALVSLGIIALLSASLAPRPIRSLVVLFSVVIGVYLVVPSGYFERLATLQDLSSDASAMGRFENWDLAWQAALRHPFTGVGPENHIPYNRSIVTNVQVRVAHSVYFQVLGELGFPALALYLLFVGMGVGTLYGTWRYMIPLATRYHDLAWVRDTAFWTMCGYVGYSVGAGFLNVFYIEFPWYAVFYGVMLRPLVQREVALRRQKESPHAQPVTAIKESAGRRDVAQPGNVSERRLPEWEKERLRRQQAAETEASTRVERFPRAPRNQSDSDAR